MNPLPSSPPPPMPAAPLPPAPAPSGRQPFTRDQRSTIMYGILGFIVILVVLQLFLITATMNAYLGGDNRVIWPAAGASIGCLLLNIGLLRYLYRIEKPR